MLSHTNFLSLFHVESRDIANIRLIWDAIKNDTVWLFDEFYAWLARRKDAYGMMFTNVQFATANRKLVEQHWVDFFTNEVDDAFIAKRHRLGKIHAQTGIALEPYTEGVAKLHDLFETLFRRCQIADFELLVSFNKLFRLETCLVIYSYTEETNHMLTLQNDALRQLSTPVARLRKQVLFLPLVGVLDSARMHDMMATVLHKIAEMQARVFLLDISGITVVDTGVANHILRLAGATKLMGCTMLIAGISPTIAETIVSLGIDTTNLLTTNSLEDALTQALKLVGEQINALSA
jgi:rsbT co-antagonist protein RsbR